MTDTAIDWTLATPVRQGETVGTGEEITIYNPDTGGLHVLNPSALAIWELCDGETTGGEMVEAVVELTGADESQADADIGSALNKLLDLGLVSVQLPDG